MKLSEPNTTPGPASDTTYIAIKTACRLRRINQDDVARRAGLDPTLFSRIVSGERIPNVLVALKIAKVLDCKVEDLFPDAEGLLFPAGAARRGRPKKVALPIP